jgi:hypothetical protein
MTRTWRSDPPSAFVKILRLLGISRTVADQGSARTAHGVRLLPFRIRCFLNRRIGEIALAQIFQGHG